MPLYGTHSIIRQKLYEATQELGFPKKLISLTSLTMEKAVCSIKLGNTISRPFITQKGLGQGDALACCLFNTALEKTVRDANVGTRGIISQPNCWPMQMTQT
jgi:hypothetical protein